MERAYIIIDTEQNENGEYIPCIVVRGTTGYYRTDWTWGKDKAVAEKCADEHNKVLGVSKVDSSIIRDLSMFPKANEKLLREHYEGLYTS